MNDEEIKKQHLCLVFLLMALAIVLLITKVCHQQDQIRVYQTQLSLPPDERTADGHKMRYTGRMP